MKWKKFPTQSVTSAIYQALVRSDKATYFTIDNHIAFI